MSQTNSTIWEVNGLSLELDLEDAGVLKQYREAFEAMEQEEKALPKDGRAEDVVIAYCMMYRHLYDRLFGEGTAEKIFGERYNSRIYDEVYFSFLDFARAQKEGVFLRHQKYSPKNRKQRRAAK